MLSLEVYIHFLDGFLAKKKGKKRKKRETQRVNTDHKHALHANAAVTSDLTEPKILEYFEFSLMRTSERS